MTRLVLLILFVLFAATASYAQVDSIYRGGRMTEIAEKEKRIAGMDRNTRARGGSPTEVNEDLNRLQVLNTSLGIKQLKEVERRATRLKENLSLPALKDKTVVPTDPNEQWKTLRESLARLLGNPVFSEMGTMDNQLLLEARADLEQIVLTSKALRKHNR